MLTDIVIILGLAVAVLLLFHFLRLPSVVGLLIIGILAGPYGFGLVGAVHEVEVLAEIGVFYLIFKMYGGYVKSNFELQTKDYGKTSQLLIEVI